MSKKQKLIQIIFVAIFFLLICMSIFDSTEKKYETNFNQERIRTHIDHITANGPHSIADKEENLLVLDYLTATLESYGIVNGDTTEVPAYQIQDFVAEDTDYQNWYLKNLIVHIPANSDEPSGEAIMFMGHTDSVPMGDGASDDGIAVAVMMEAIRYYLNQMDNGYTLTNDLVFCFVNGEEYGLYGSDAFMNEFTGFDDVVRRIRFGTNLESRGTNGTLIMFETAADNYNTVRLFSEINKNVFTCSLATMIYDMMPNGTDFSNFKEAYQGLNFANISGGENYHTQNDNLETIKDSYLSQQAQIVDAIIERLANYELSLLYDAEESAIFFSYLNLSTVVYNHTTAAILAVLLIIMLLVNIIQNKNAHNGKRTAAAIGTIILGLALTAAVTYGCYYLFQYIAAFAKVIDIHMVGTITYSNTAIILGIGLTALAATALCSYLAVRWFNISYRDLTRGFAYVHAFLGIVLSFALADVSYLFVFSGLMFMANELLISFVKKTDFAGYHFEVLASALYLPIIMPVLVLATSALGLTMAYVFGVIFALGIFGFGIYLAPYCEYLSIRKLFGKKELKTTPAEGALHIFAAAMIIFLCVSLSQPDVHANLQGKQNISRLPSDDALVYVADASGDTEYRIYDLNAYPALKNYAPELSYQEDHYAGEGTPVQIEHAIASRADSSTLTITKVHEDATVYLSFENIQASSFTIDDTITTNTYEFDGAAAYDITIHSDCTVTVNGGSADVTYKEVIRDYAPLIPEAYQPEERLHFNLWLTDSYHLGA